MFQQNNRLPDSTFIDFTLLSYSYEDGDDNGAEGDVVGPSLPEPTDAADPTNLTDKFKLYIDDVKYTTMEAEFIEYMFAETADDDLVNYGM